MRSIWKRSNLGFVMMLCPPLLALPFGVEAFFPVVFTSILGGTVLLLSKSLTTQVLVGQLTAELVEDLVSAEKDRRDLVLAELKEAEGNWFLAELPRAKAELGRGKGSTPADCRTRARWAWHIQYS
jgi:hypothetical protein